MKFINLRFSNFQHGDSRYPEFIRNKIDTWKHDSSLNMLDGGKNKYERDDNAVLHHFDTVQMMQILENSIINGEKHMKDLSDSVPSKEEWETICKERNRHVQPPVPMFQSSAYDSGRYSRKPVRPTPQTSFMDSQHPPPPVLDNSEDGTFLPVLQELLTPPHNYPHKINYSRTSNINPNIDENSIKIIPQLIGLSPDGQLVLIPMTAPINNIMHSPFTSSHVASRGSPVGENSATPPYMNHSVNDIISDHKKPHMNTSSDAKFIDEDNRNREVVSDLLYQDKTCECQSNGETQKKLNVVKGSGNRQQTDSLNKSTIRDVKNYGNRQQTEVDTLNDVRSKNFDYVDNIKNKEASDRKGNAAIPVRDKNNNSKTGDESGELNRNSTEVAFPSVLHQSSEFVPEYKSPDCIEVSLTEELKGYPNDNSDYEIPTESLSEEQSVRQNKPRNDIIIEDSFSLGEITEPITNSVGKKYITKDTILPTTNSTNSNTSSSIRIEATGTKGQSTSGIENTKPAVNIESADKQLSSNPESAHNDTKLTVHIETNEVNEQLSSRIENTREHVDIENSNHMVTSVSDIIYSNKNNNNNNNSIEASDESLFSSFSDGGSGIQLPSHADENNYDNIPRTDPISNDVHLTDKSKENILQQSEVDIKETVDMNASDSLDDPVLFYLMDKLTERVQDNDSDDTLVLNLEVDIHIANTIIG